MKNHEAMNISAATNSMNHDRCMTINGPTKPTKTDRTTYHEAMNISKHW